MRLLLAPAVFLLVWVAGLASGLRLDFARDRMMQFIGAEELAGVSYLEAWQSLHMQPPGFTMLLKFSDGLGASGNWFWLVLLLLATIAGLWMVGDIVWTLTGNLRWAVGAGLLAALLPGTLYYALWVFYTTLTAFLLTLMVWGMVRGLVRRSLIGWILAALSVIPLFLLRSTYVWPVLVVWLLTVVILVWRRGQGLVVSAKWIVTAASLLAVVCIAVVQSATWVAYGVMTQSSWGYENAAKAVMTQLTEQEQTLVARGDACLEQVLAAGVFEPIDAYPTCAREGAVLDRAHGSALLEAEYWASGYPNMNTLDRLALSDQWRTWVTQAVIDNPAAVARIPFPNLETQERGTIVRFLWPSSWYWLLDANVAKGGMLASGWILLFSWVPVVGLGGILLGLWGSRTFWPVRDPRRIAFRIGSSVVLVVTIAYLFLETGENERFRVEIDWLIIALGAVGWLVWSRRTRELPEDQGEPMGLSSSRR